MSIVFFPLVCHFFLKNTITGNTSYFSIIPGSLNIPVLCMVVTLFHITQMHRYAHASSAKC